MRKNIIWLLISIVCFGAGYKAHKPKIIEKIKEVKVYGWPEGTNLQNLCASVFGESERKRKEETAHEMKGYRNGYQDGLNQGMRE